MNFTSVPFPILFITVFILIILSMIFSAAESAFISVNKLRIRILRNKKDRRAFRVWKLLNNKDRLINTLVIAGNITNTALSVIITFISVSIFGYIGIIVATLAVTVLILVFGKISPKIFATHHPEKTAFFFSRFIEILEIILMPLVFIFTQISRPFLRILNVDFKKKKVSYTEEEIKTFLDVGHEQGIIETNEKNMMTRVFKFTDLEARDIMIPRIQIKAVSINDSYSGIIELSQRLRFSRFPVYKKDMDDIVGILYIKDMLPYKNKPEIFNVQKVMRPPLFILETKKMSGIQQMLWENHQSMAVVIDEYSGTYGILTREDIIREIFGPVNDDKKNYARRLEPQADGIQNFEADGFIRLVDINEQLGINLASENCETLGGFICEKTDSIPSEGDSVVSDGYEFCVLKMEDNRVKRVGIKKKTGESDDGSVYNF